MNNLNRNVFFIVITLLLAMVAGCNGTAPKLDSPASGLAVVYTMIETFAESAEVGLSEGVINAEQAQTINDMLMQAFNAAQVAEVAATGGKPKTAIEALARALDILNKVEGML